MDGKLQAILQAPKSSKCARATFFLGLVNYYSKFIPNLATVLHLLNQLLHHADLLMENLQLNSQATIGIFQCSHTLATTLLY